MAKEDFCFTYYDGDAARDTTHMNRLERGAYHDFIISQRKFGHLTLDQVKKILGKDFNECWPAMELIMKTDPDGKFYIEWLHTSITKSKKHSKKQTDNVNKRYQTDTNNIPKIDLVIPLGDGNGDGDGSELELNKKEPVQKIESSDFKYEFLEDESLADCENWTAQIIQGNDMLFLAMVRNNNITLNGQLERMARDHLGLCARYNWHEKLTSQQAFRQSLVGHIRKEQDGALKKLPLKSKKFTIDEMNS
jgi:hypothetical protein